MSRVQQIVRQPASRHTGSRSMGLASLVLAGLVAVLVLTPHAVGSAAKEAGAPIVWMPQVLNQWQQLFIGASEEHGVDPDLLAIVTLLESLGNPDAVSSRGATGLMQIMPSTARWIAEARGIEDFDPDGLADPELNIDFGAWYLSRQLNAFGSGRTPEAAIELAAAAYNGGPKLLKSHLEEGSDLTEEARRYSRMVKVLWMDRNETESGSFERWAQGKNVSTH